MNKRWIAYGVTGVLGLGVIAGGATVAANGMELRTQTGEVLPGGSITDRSGARTAGSDLSEKEAGASDDRADVRPSAGADTVPTPNSSPTPVTPPAPVTPQSVQTPDTAPSAATAVSPISPASVASAASNDD